MKQLGEMTYEEFVEHVTLEAHKGLLKGGSEGMNSAIFLWLSQYETWKFERVKFFNKKAKKVKK